LQISEKRRPWLQKTENELDFSVLKERIMTEIDKLSEKEVSPATKTRIRKWIERITKETTTKEAVHGAFQILSVYASTPLGSAVISTLILIALAKILKSKNPVEELGITIGIDTMIGVIWTEELLSALGGSQGVISSVGALGALFK
jgi:hypothetical protein